MDRIRSPVCEACPSLDPSVVVCEGETVKSQPGYFSHTSTGSSRRADSYAAIAVTKCPNQQACKRVGLMNLVASDDPSTKCDIGYTGILLHTTSHRELIMCHGVPGLLCAECDSGWFASKLVGSLPH